MQLHPLLVALPLALGVARTEDEECLRNDLRATSHEQTGCSTARQNFGDAHAAHYSCQYFKLV